MNFTKISSNFYLRDCLVVSKELIGKYLVRIINNKDIIIGKIIETECYKGNNIDKACHAYKNKKTKRTEALFLKGGHIYVYLIYGMYYCLNIVTEKENIPAATLIRSVEIIQGIEKASEFRYNKSYRNLSKYEIKNFSNGPGKVCKAFNINIAFNKKNLFKDEIFISEKIEGINNEKYNIKKGKRINIDYSKEAKDFLWRFYI